MKDRNSITTTSGESRWTGAAGLATIALVVVLVLPNTAGMVARPLLVVKAPYKGSYNSPYYSAVASGCASGKIVEAKWAKLSGIVRASVSASSKTCRVLGGGNAGGTATSITSINVEIPFLVASSGKHSVASSWTISLASIQLQTSGHCPRNWVNPFPPLGNSEGALCQDSAGLAITLSEAMMDLNNFAWYTFNSSSADSYNTAGWENSTSCFNYGTPSCSNYTGSTGYAYSTGSNDPGFNGYNFNGSTSLTLWNNATGMVSGHRYVLMITIGITATSYAFMYNLKRMWTASGTASLNMATLSNGAKLNSVTIT